MSKLVHYLRDSKRFDEDQLTRLEGMCELGQKRGADDLLRDNQAKDGGAPEREPEVWVNAGPMEPSPCGSRYSRPPPKEGCKASSKSYDGGGDHASSRAGVEEKICGPPGGWQHAGHVSKRTKLSVPSLGG